MARVPKLLRRRKHDARVCIPVVLRGGWVNSAGHAALGPGEDGEYFTGRHDPRTDPPGVSAGLEFATLVDAGRAIRRSACGGSARSALCLQHGDAASGNGEIPLRTAPPSAQNADRLGGFARERIRAAEPVSREISV